MIRRDWVIGAVPAAVIISAPRDGCEQERHGQRQAQVHAQEADVDGVRVLDHEDQHHDEGGGARDQRDAHAALVVVLFFVMASSIALVGFGPMPTITAGPASRAGQ
jgi:hypothetical protein